MGMTKTEIRNCFMIMENLGRLCRQISEKVVGECRGNKGCGNKDLLRESLDDIIAGKASAENEWRDLGFMFDNCVEGNENSAPQITIDPNGNVTVKQSVDGGTLVTAICCPDKDGTEQAVLMFENGDGDAFDLAMAEQKRGELAKFDDKDADNKDIDLYVWSDPSTEDYQYKFPLSYDNELC